MIEQRSLQGLDALPANPSKNTASAWFLRGGLQQRILLLALILTVEAVLAPFLHRDSLIQNFGTLTRWVLYWGELIFKGGIGFVAVFTTFAYLRNRSSAKEILFRASEAPLRGTLLATHIAAVAVFGALTIRIYSGLSEPESGLLALVRFLIVLAAVASLALAFMPGALWRQILRCTGHLWMYALAAAVGACVALDLSRALWQERTAGLTFALVRLILVPILPDMVVEPARRLIGTHRFTAIIAPYCSGLEGVALLLIFGTVWLVLFRKESRFPHALLLLPAGVLVLFLLNALRIAILILIGNAGGREIAAHGFHSQAGWIAFNSVAFGFSVVARRLPWFHLRVPGQVSAHELHHNPVSAYLVPLLAILAAGMVARAFSSDFEWLYPLRFLAAVGALWLFRREYANIDWRIGWLAPLTGVVVFLLWIGLEHIPASHAKGEMPPALASASSRGLILWISVRVLAATITVPLAEELAFRGFLMRRFISADFENVPFKRFTWFAVLASSVIFGLLHGQRWLAGVVAGVLYALICIRQGRLGDAWFAHLTTNVLIAAYVLLFQRWDLW